MLQTLGFTAIAGLGGGLTMGSFGGGGLVVGAGGLTVGLTGTIGFSVSVFFCFYMYSLLLFHQM